MNPDQIVSILLQETGVDPESFLNNFKKSGKLYAGMGEFKVYGLDQTWYVNGDGSVRFCNYATPTHMRKGREVISIARFDVDDYVKRNGIHPSQAYAKIIFLKDIGYWLKNGPNAYRPASGAQTTEGLRYRNIAPVQFMTLLPGAPYNAWFVAVEPFQGLDDNVYKPGDRIALSTLNQWGYAVPPQEYQRFISSGGYAKRRKYAGGGE